MTKKVKVTVSGLPIVSTSVPLLVGTHGPFVLDEKDIFKCIIAGAKVVELFDNGFEKVLTLSNYKDTPQSRHFSDIKPEKVHLEPSKDELKEVFEDTVKEVTTGVASTNKEVNSAVTADETLVEEVKTEKESVAVETKSPEHWTPPQRYSNNNNNRNNGKNKGNGKK